ncbi:hypothetical protein RUM43_010424 [Polyplax serrata]|uniref:Uncharacterized protein n=1 Tax=Polyplax serrata TaxID=468196 RepID=A0AAN8S784_POLSC
MAEYQRYRGVGNYAFSTYLPMCTGRNELLLSPPKKKNPDGKIDEGPIDRAPECISWSGINWNSKYESLRQGPGRTDRQTDRQRYKHG